MFLSAARSCRAASPPSPPRSSANSRARSSARGSSVCCLTSFASAKKPAAITPPVGNIHKASGSSVCRWLGLPGASNRSKGAGQLMIAIILVALAAGCASALMFASMMSGALISLLLVNLAPLPLMVAALGWGPLCATIGGIGAATVLGSIFGPPDCITFAVAVALPAWWLGHLALLGRPVTNGVSSGNGAPPVAPPLEWYPLGRILLWITVFAVLTTMAALLTLGTDAATITGALRRGLLRIVAPGDAPSAGQAEQWIDAFVAMAPAAAAIVAMMTLTLNLWLAAKVT